MSVYFEPENIGGVLIGNSWEVCGYEGPGGTVEIPAQCKIGQVREIGRDAFRGCKTIIRVIIPDTVKWIGRDAFRDCVNLQEVEFLGSVEMIAEEAFSGCKSLKSVTGHVWNIGQNAFSGCEKLVDSEGFQVVHGYLMHYSGGGSEIRIPEGVKIINHEVFRDQIQLESVKLPRSLEMIGEAAFAGCTNLKQIHIPDRLIRIYRNAFCGCEALYDGDFIIRDGWLLAFRDTTPNGRMKDLVELTIPETVHTIGDYVFYRSRRLTSVTIPSTVKKIGSFAFYKCAYLRSVTMEAGVETIGNSAFSGSPVETVEVPDSVSYLGPGMFRDCKSMIRATLGKNVHQMMEGIFEGCENLTDVTLPETLVSLPKDTFKNCDRLPRVELPRGMRRIQESGFEGCAALQSIGAPEKLLWLEKRAFANCVSLKQVPIPEKGVKIEENAFYNCPALAGEDGLTILKGAVAGYCGDAEVLVIPEGVTEISDSAFYQYAHSFGKPIRYPNHPFRKVILPEGLKRIGSMAFCHCDKLQEVVFPASLEEIGDRAFAMCFHFPIPTLPDSVKIGKNAFEGCIGEEEEEFSLELPECDE